MPTWRTLLFWSAFLCFSYTIQGQCVQDQLPSFDCIDALPICGFQLDGYTGVLPDFAIPSGPIPLCLGQGVPNNTIWLAFIPTSDYIEIEVRASCDTIMQGSNPMPFTGIQAAIYSDCQFGEVIDCSIECDVDSVVLGGPVIANQIHYLMLDGCAGSVCEFTLRTRFGTFTGESRIIGYDTVCANNPLTRYVVEPLEAMATVEWLVDDLLSHNVVNQELVIEDWGGLDSTLICVAIEQGGQGPDTICKLVYIDDFNLLEEGLFTYCAEDGGYLYSDGQIYPEGEYEVIDTTGICIEITRFEVALRELDLIEVIEEKICPGDTVFFDNYFFTQPTDTLLILDQPNPNGCEDQVQLIITPQVDSMVVYSTVICPGDTAFYFYGLSFTQATDTTIIRPIPHPNNCNDQERIIINMFPADSLEIVSENLCPGETLIFDGQIFSAPLDTILTLSTPNPNGCEDQVQLIITNPSLQLQSDSNSCPGTFTAFIEAQVLAGSPPYQYEWTGPIDLPDSARIDDLPSGWYSLTVTDNNGCVLYDSLEIGEYPEIDATIITSPASGGQSNGSAEIVFNGGTPPFTTVWAVPGLPMDVLRIDGVAAGDYQVLVTDGNACQRLFAFEIPMSTSLTEIEAALDWDIYPNPTSGSFWLRGEMAEERNVEIRDVQGRLENTRLLWPAGQELLWVDDQTLPSGVYWIVVKAAGAHQVQKLIKLE